MWYLDSEGRELLLDSKENVQNRDVDGLEFPGIDI
jgi:hypothetical protein